MDGDPPSKVGYRRATRKLCSLRGLPPIDPKLPFITIMAKRRGVGGRLLRCPCLPASTPPRSTHRLRLGESPCAVEDFTSWEKESHRVVPPLRDRQAIWDLAVAPAK